MLLHLSTRKALRLLDKIKSTLFITFTHSANEIKIAEIVRHETNKNFHSLLQKSLQV
jgi:hypothetical protein